MKPDKPLEYTLADKKKKAHYFIKIAGSELTRILYWLRPERCAPGESKYPFIRDLIEVRIDDTRKYLDRMKESDATITFEREPYRRIVCSAGHARSHKVFFLHADMWEPVMKILACGMDLRKPFSPSKTNAYFGLVASNSVPVAELPRIVVVDDLEMNVRDTFDVVRANIASGKYELERGVNTEKKTNIFDGSGLVSVEQAERWAKELGLNYTPAAFQIRALPALKGVLFTFDIRRFAEEFGCCNIVDKWGAVRDGLNADVIMTKSMFKFHSLYDNFEEWETAFNTPEHGYRRTFNIASWSEDPRQMKKRGNVNTAYQMIQTLELDNRQIKELAGPTVKSLKKLRTDPDALLKYLRVDDSDDELEDDPWYQVPPYFKALKYDTELLRDEFVARKVDEACAHAERKAYAGKLKVKGNYQILAPDIYALAQHAFGLPVTGILPAWEIYSYYWNENSTSATEVDMVRNPHVAHEHCVMRLNKSPEAVRWYKYQTATVITSVRDSSVLRCNGADFDGDKVLTTKNSVMLAAAKAGNVNTILEIKDDAKPPEYAMDNMEALLWADKNSFACDIGQIINPVTRLWSMPQSQKRDDAISVMSVVASEAIDAAKTGATVKVPAHINRMLKDVRKPKFMKYRKNEQGENWGDQDCTMNRVCRHIQKAIQAEQTASTDGEFSPTWFILRDRPFVHHGQGYKNTRNALRVLQDEYQGLCMDYSKTSGKWKADYNANFSRHFAKCRKQLISAFYGADSPNNVDELIDCVIQLLYYDKAFVGVHDYSILWHSFGDEMIERVKTMRGNKSEARLEAFEVENRRQDKAACSAKQARAELKLGCEYPTFICQETVEAIGSYEINSAERRFACALSALNRKRIEIKPLNRDGLSPSFLCGQANVPRHRYDQLLAKLDSVGAIDWQRREDGTDIVQIMLPQGGEVVKKINKATEFSRAIDIMERKFFEKKN